MPYLKALFRLRQRITLCNTKWLCLPLLLWSFSLSSYFDIESLYQQFVQDTTRIIIPGHPHAFNPSIIRWKQGVLLSFREIVEDPLNPRSEICSSGNSYIGIVWLDDDLRPKSTPQILQLHQEDSQSPSYSRAEDARLVTIGERLYLVYSDNKADIVTEGGFRMHVAELDFDGDSFAVGPIEILNDFQGQHPQKREKNWTPFEYNGEMHLAYSLYPHRILRPLFGIGYSETVASTKSMMHWYCGELRGGTPALKISDQHYLSFFHSSMNLASVHSGGMTMPHYFMGAYLFSTQPPFEITHISDEPIVGKNFYHGEIYEPYWHPVRVVFPCGFIFDEKTIWMAYGRQDHEIWICRIDKAGLLGSLSRVR